MAAPAYLYHFAAHWMVHLLWRDGLAPGSVLVKSPSFDQPAAVGGEVRVTVMIPRQMRAYLRSEADGTVRYDGTIPPAWLHASHLCPITRAA